MKRRRIHRGGRKRIGSRRRVDDLVIRDRDARAICLSLVRQVDERWRREAASGSGGYGSAVNCTYDVIREFADVLPPTVVYRLAAVGLWEISIVNEWVVRR